ACRRHPARARVLQRWHRARSARVRRRRADRRRAVRAVAAGPGGPLYASRGLRDGSALRFLVLRAGRDVARMTRMRTNVYRVHGMMQSYFTRKMTGYLDYKGIPWVLRRFPGASPEAMASGFPGGVPPVQTPAGEFMWDSTAMIHHLELRFPRAGRPSGRLGAALPLLPRRGRR